MNLISIAAAALAAVAVFLITYGISKHISIDEVAKRLEHYGPSKTQSGLNSESIDSKSSLSLKDNFRNINNKLSKQLSRTSVTGKLADDLARADLKFKSSEWIGMLILAGIILGFLFSLRFHSAIGFITGPLISWLAGGFILKYLQNRRSKAFDRQIAEVVILLSNALKAGYAFSQAIDNITKTATAPISTEFSRASREIALGISVDDALTHMAKRSGSEDFDLIATVIQIHRSVGGNLSEILETIAFTIRERVRIKGEISALTAQARISGIIISLLPIGLAVVLSLLSPAYFRPMFSATLGQIMLGAGAVMMVIGWGIMKKISKIEV